MKRAGLLILILVLTFCGCKTENDDVAGEEVFDLSNLTEIAEDIDYGDTTYNMQTDSQNYFGTQTNTIAKANNGYYKWEYSNATVYNGTADMFLIYYDGQSGSAIPVCSRIDCLHNTSDCDAAYNENLNSLCYYDGYLYSIFMEWSQEDEMLTDCWLYRISLDGSKREKVKYLYSYRSDGEFGSTTLPELQIHRGYAYYSYTNNSVSYLSMCDIENGYAIKQICKCSGLYSVICSVRGYGEGVVFESFYYNNENGDDLSSKIVYFNPKTEKINLLYEGMIGTSAIADGNIILTDGKDMFKLNLDDFSVEKFIEDCSGNPSYDGENIYIDNSFQFDDYSDHKVYVYNIIGELIDTIDLSGVTSTSEFGDDKYLFQRFDDGHMYILDKSQIGTGSHEWIELPINQ